MKHTWRSSEVIVYIVLGLICLPAILFVSTRFPLVAYPILVAAIIRIVLENLVSNDTVKAVQAALQMPFQQKQFLLPLALIFLITAAKACTRKHRHSANVGLWLGFIVATALRMLAIMTFVSTDRPVKDKHNRPETPWEMIEWIMLSCIIDTLREVWFKFTKEKYMPMSLQKLTLKQNSASPKDSSLCAEEADGLKLVKSFIHTDCRRQACFIVWFELVISIPRCLYLRWVSEGLPNKSDNPTTEEVLTPLLVPTVTVWQLAR